MRWKRRAGNAESINPSVTFDGALKLSEKAAAAACFLRFWRFGDDVVST